jgi:hypothetical protein
MFLKRKSQIELSMLTRFAMVFFIISLAAIMLLFSNSEQRGLCKTQAQLTASQISSSINQVLVSPAEDERKVIPLESALSIGQRDRAQYTVKITDRPSASSLSVGVESVGKDCSAFQSVGYDPNVFLTLQGTEPSMVVAESFSGEPDLTTLVLNPSAPSKRTFYLIVLKCKQKIFGGEAFLYLQGCTYEDPGSCLSLDSITECQFPSVH